MKKRHSDLIGFPVDHTMSPLIHGELFRLARVSMDYTVFFISLERFVQPKKKERLLELDSFNVTIPRKQTVMTLLGKTDEKAAAFSPVSTVKNENRCLCGFTIDGRGFQKSLRATGIPMGGRDLILGSEGTPRVMVLELADAAYFPGLTICIRESGLPSARKLADILAEHLHREQKDFLMRVYRYNELDPAESCDLAVNGTPAGIYPNTHTILPLLAELYQDISAVFNAVYNPEDTLFLQIARRIGAMAVGSMDTLVWQVATAQHVWYSAEPGPRHAAEISRSAILEMNRMFGGAKK